MKPTESINDIGIYLEILEDIKKLKVSNFRNLVDSYTGELSRIKKDSEPYEANIEKAIEEHLEEVNKLRDSAECLVSKLKILLANKNNLYFYINYINEK